MGHPYRQRRVCLSFSEAPSVLALLVPPDASLPCRERGGQVATGGIGSMGDGGAGGNLVVESDHGTPSALAQFHAKCRAHNQSTNSAA
jgi:hypothetical protein